jgi:pimeloyl-ACP methyl ester carboxylesterase
MASQHGLDSLKSDVACVTRCFGRVSGPVVLVGHSYGGTLITHAGMDERVAALVYIAALAPDADETSQSLQNKFPKTDVFAHIEVPDRRVWLKASGVPCFGGDLPEAQQRQQRQQRQQQQQQQQRQQMQQQQQQQRQQQQQQQQRRPQQQQQRQERQQQ